jgi:hypothetical protein
MRQHAFMHGPQMEGGAANPVGQRRTVEIDSLAGVDLRLPVERQMIGVFGDEDLRHGRLGWNAALDQSRRRGAPEPRLPRRRDRRIWAAPVGPITSLPSMRG